MEMTFKLEAKQVEEARKWIDKHPCKFRNSRRTGAIGGKTTYTFTNTSIGQIANIECACGAKECLTDIKDL